MTYLINAVNTYRVPTVEDALELREELSNLIQPNTIRKPKKNIKW